MKNFRTVIIGSGVVGSTIAYHLSMHESKVLVIDKKFPAGGTSGATQAWVWVHTKQPDYYGELSLFSAELYPALKKQLPLEFEYHRCGGIAPIFDEDSLKKAEKMVESQRKRGIQAQILSREETLQKEPVLNPSLIAATYSPHDGHLNPMRLLAALMRGAQKNGVEFSFYNPVIQLKVEGHAKYIVTTEKGIFSCERLVIAGGPWAQELTAMLGFSIPIKLVKGQILVTEPFKPFLRHIVTGIRQTNNGELLIGYSKEESGMDRSVTFNIAGETARFAKRIIPSIENIRIVRTFAGIRSVPVDGLPILGEVPGFEGLYVASMHSGITLAPITGVLMAELIASGKTSIPIENYNISRFM